ncbi:hypothetical protein F2Q69_00029938 [Brassica cretica]|uniref:Uncharacterized protein n=1 Tax=Brassica cretica TaxID=69181 RepID=A0A8S9S4U8_BRACR|nr:hypothetical protein F2Q69_00029938 [Brassica cretica]
MIQEQHAIGAGTSKSIDADTQPSIDARLASFKDRLQSFAYKLDDVYYPLNDSIERLTTRMDELKEEIDMIRRQNAILSEASIDGLTRALIVGRYTHLQGKLVIMKLLEDKLDEINFSQDLMREDVEETIYAKLRMQQGCIGNLQNRMHVIGVDKEILKNQWTRGDEAIRSFIGTWFQMSKDDVDT